MRSIRITAYLALISFVGINSSFAKIFNEVVIEGNQRIETESIRSHLRLQKGRNHTKKDFDAALKRLFATEFFEDAYLKFEESVLMVHVMENPVVSRVGFEGNNEIDDEILKHDLQLRSRQVYTLTRLKNDTQRIQDLYRLKGYFSAVVTPQIVKLEQNRVDVVFEIKESKPTVIRRIVFIGNKAFSENKLESIIQTKETRWYRFFNTQDNYDPDRLAYDRELLRRFYLDHGYVNFRVKSAFAELTPDHSEFFITYTLKEGYRYKFGKIKIDSEIETLDLEQLRSYLTIKEKDWYSKTALEKSIENLTNSLGILGYAFVDIQPKVKKNDDLTIDLSLDLREGPHVYIDQIIITGNERTNEDVIRREIRLFEGDAYDTSKLKESKRRIRNLGFFKKVTIKKEPSDNADKVNLIIAVKEEPHTGELSLSGGFSTVDGPLVGVQLSEHNLQGKGQEIRAKIEVAKRRQEFDIGFTEPYFLNRSLSAGFDIFSISRQKFFESSFDQRTYGLRLRAGYELAENLQQTWSYKINRERVTGVSSKASEFIREQEGWATESTIGHSLIYDRRNTRFDPTSGFYVGMDNSFIGVGGDIRLLGNSLFGGYFYSPYEGWILGLTGRAGIIMGLSQKVRVVDRYTLGGYSLRGFEIGGVGPRDKETGDLLGGLRYYKGTAELLFPSGLPNEFGLKWSVFTDFGSLWHSGDPSNDVLGTPAIRVSAGFGLSWSTPLGPIRLDFAWHVVKQKQDATRVFLFSIGPRF